MKRLYYPAIFHSENGKFWVEFPDLPGCFTEGDSIEETIGFAKDAMATWFTPVDENKVVFPKACDPSKIKVKEGSFVMMIEYDSLYWAKRQNSKAIKKTLTIPGWLDDIAKKNNVNYSQTLKEALIQKLDL